MSTVLTCSAFASGLVAWSSSRSFSLTGAVRGRDLGDIDCSIAEWRGWEQSAARPSVRWLDPARLPHARDFTKIRLRIKFLSTLKWLPFVRFVFGLFVGNVAPPSQPKGGSPQPTSLGATDGRQAHRPLPSQRRGPHLRLLRHRPRLRPRHASRRGDTPPNRRGAHGARGDGRASEDLDDGDRVGPPALPHQAGRQWRHPVRRADRRPQAVARVVRKAL